MHESILATTRDALYGWTAVRLVKKQAALGQPAFLYLFDHGYPAADAATCTASTPANFLMSSGLEIAPRRAGQKFPQRQKKKRSRTR